MNMLIDLLLFWLKDQLCILFFLSQSQRSLQYLSFSYAHGYMINFADITMTMTGGTRYNAPPLGCYTYFGKKYGSSMMIAFVAILHPILSQQAQKLLLPFQAQLPLTTVAHQSKQRVWGLILGKQNEALCRNLYNCKHFLSYIHTFSMCRYVLLLVFN